MRTNTKTLSIIAALLLVGICSAWGLLFPHKAELSIASGDTSDYAIYKAQGVTRSIVYTAPDSLPTTVTLRLKDEPSGAEYYSTTLSTGTNIVSGLSLYTAGQTRLSVDIPSTTTQSLSFTIKVIEER
ncbi:MAG: hypothetical protein ACXQT6_05425 [Candidatus Methanospirareceae archaeon]